MPEVVAEVVPAAVAVAGEDGSNTTAAVVVASVAVDTFVGTGCSSSSLVVPVSLVSPIPQSMVVPALSFGTSSN